jgi:dephospho-CoA kinase
LFTASENGAIGMKTFGLTGGVGMGKSTAAEFLRVRGAQVVDTDELARQLVEPGESALAEIQNVFGEKIISDDGRLRRDELARIVFADSAARKKLEEILHPKIRDRWLAQIEIWRRENHPLAVVVIPLLFETQAQSQFDKIICVACSDANRQKRLLERGWTPEQIQQRIAAQMPADQKIALSDFVIWTDAGLESHSAQLDLILAGL